MIKIESTDYGPYIVLFDSVGFLLPQDLLVFLAGVVVGGALVVWLFL